jgi:hypothetical protein
MNPKHVLRRGGAIAVALLALAAPAASATCPAQAASQVFLPWSDQSWYTLVADGSFDAGAKGWTLSGGAAVVADNSPFRKAGTRTAALRLPAGGRALSPPICVGLGYPYLRAFARTAFAPQPTGATLGYELLFTDRAGKLVVKTLGAETNSSVWKPTRRTAVPVGVLDVAQYTNGSTTIRYRFTATDSTTWLLDDVFVDPWVRG